MGISLALGTGAGLAWAASTDNLVPTLNYSAACDEEPGTICQTDNADVYYYMDLSDDAGDGRDNKLEAEDIAKVREVMANSFNGTDLNTYYDATPVFDGDSETDIYYEEWAPPTGLDGFTRCNDDSPSPKYACDQQHVRIKGGGFYTRYGVVCHETGHAVGLVHGDRAYPVQYISQPDPLHCMAVPAEDHYGLGPSNVANINATY
ncbi:hypothetical protein R1T08_16935 [Streptomyces sp. SBC-4]|nr:hypothetical protein [Streptomyces sp. SBC-4]MDV5145847.1 hypothetical protein [Streptomyces sp. SBC-4]